MRNAALALVLVVAIGVAVVVAVPPVRDEVLVLSAKARWVRDMYDAIAAELPQLSPSSRLLVLAHAAYESGWGTAKAARRGHNVFNITAGSAWTGPAWDDVGGDTEYDAAGNVTRITQRWRIYGSLREAVADYWRFLGPNANRGRYVNARAALERGDLSDFGVKLYAAGYFTLPPQKYVTQLAAVFELAKVVLDEAGGA